MKTTRLVSALLHTETQLDRSTSSRAHRERLRHDLLAVVSLRRPPTPRLLRHAPQLRSHALLERIGYVSAALHAVARYGLSVAAAAKMTDLAVQDILFAIAMLERCGRTLAWVDLNVDDGVKAAIDASTQNLVVRLHPDAIAGMVSAAIECAVLRRDGSYSEMYGSAWGTATTGQLDEKNERLCSVRIDRFTPQIKARTSEDSFLPSSRSHAAHQLVTEKLLRDGTEPLVAVHSHPYATLSELLRCRGWRYSAADQQEVVCWQTERRAAGQRGFASIIVAVAPGSERGARARRLSRNRLRLRVGSWHLFLTAFRTQLDGELDNCVRLEAPTLLHGPVIATLGGSEISTTRSQLLSSRSLS